jgi:hypothetical protein
VYSESQLRVVGNGPPGANQIQVFIRMGLISWKLLLMHSISQQNWMVQNGDFVFEADVEWNTSVYIISYTPMRSGLFNLSALFFVNGTSFHVSGSPFPLFVRPSANVSAVKSSACGSALTLSTIGTRSYFTISTRDMYGGIQFSDSPKFRIFISGQAPPSNYALERIEESGYVVSYIAIVAGDFAFHLCAPLGNGFQAEYYADTSFMTSTFNRIDQEIDFTWHRGRPGTDLFVQARKPGLSFAVRWSGFLFSDLNQMHTISVELLESDERVRMWFDNTLLVDQVICKPCTFLIKYAHESFCAVEEH